MADNKDSPSLEEYELKLDKDGIPVVNSTVVAARFGRRHDNLLALIDDISLKLRRLNIDNWFRETHYLDRTGRQYPSFDMTRDGWDLLVMGFTGDDVLPIKVAFIQSWHAMEETIRTGRGPSDLLKAQIAELQALFREGRGRINLTPAVQRQHIDEVRRQGCACPMCRDITIVDTRGIIRDDDKLVAEFDHFYHVGKANLYSTWLICVGCHRKLTDGVIRRADAEPSFRAYQQLLIGHLPGHQATLF